MLVLVAALALPSVARADFENDYAFGLKALDDGRLIDARQFLEKALAARPEPTDKVMLGGKIEQPYLPYHFLGIVAFRLGDCEQARALWANPMNSRMIGRLNQIRQQEQRMLPACQPRSAREASTSGQAAPPASAPAPAVPAPTPAAEPAASTPAVPAAPATTASSAKVSSERRERQAAAPAAEAARPAQDTAAAAERTPPPERLVQAFDSYLAGRYADAATIDPQSLSGARARFHALLIRAASRFTQAQLEGDEKLLAAARSDAAAARALDSRTLPDAAAFSPRFRAFYAAAR